MITNIKEAYLCLRCEKGKNVLVPYLYLVLINGSRKPLSNFPFLNHLSPTEGIPMASEMAPAEIWKSTPTRLECLLWKLIMNFLVSSGWLLTSLTFSQKWKHLVFWKHDRILGEEVMATMLWGSNLLIFPPLCFGLKDLWLLSLPLLISTPDIVIWEVVWQPMVWWSKVMESTLEDGLCGG